MASLEPQPSKIQVIKNLYDEIATIGVDIINATNFNKNRNHLVTDVESKLLELESVLTQLTNSEVNVVYNTIKDQLNSLNQRKKEFTSQKQDNLRFIRTSKGNAAHKNHLQKKVGDLMVGVRILGKAIAILEITVKKHSKLQQAEEKIESKSNSSPQNLQSAPSVNAKSVTKKKRKKHSKR